MICPANHDACRRRVGHDCDEAGERDPAVQAYAAFGKGWQAARLTMGDCFTYACAKADRAWLLFNGDDFAKTDIATAG